MAASRSPFAAVRGVRSKFPEHRSTIGYPQVMRRAVTTQKLKAFMQELAKRATGPGNVYLVGGSSALLLGIREQTIDIDLKLRSFLGENP